MGGEGILGGTFNPIHTGHIRHALEVGETLGLDRVWLMPCASPPHKSHKGLLSFDLRVRLLEEAVCDIPLLGISTLESELHGPSYTWKTLTEWQNRQPGSSLPFFLLGVEDFMGLWSWQHGKKLPQLAHLVVAPRAGSDLALFESAVQQLWPGSVPLADTGQIGVTDGRRTFSLTGGGRATFLPVPRLDISASLVRERWRLGRDLHGLLPDRSLRLLEKCRDMVDELWGKK